MFIRTEILNPFMNFVVQLFCPLDEMPEFFALFSFLVSVSISYSLPSC